uniref:RGS domain-containing protein n=1 Tax=Rhizochromulina marina TaxID=1034831 RepID=A0A7S2RGI9_9STRA|mmetsp:Transcript_16019/g.46993  ORF Transcript_16019/g.46993 Transcript_16019/m.46993 type:complete len:479 (+) Transcript_16019:170-1606(+)
MFSLRSKKVAPVADLRPRQREAGHRTKAIVVHESLSEDYSHTVDYLMLHIRNLSEDPRQGLQAGEMMLSLSRVHSRFGQHRLACEWAREAVLQVDKSVKVESHPLLVEAVAWEKQLMGTIRKLNISTSFLTKDTSIRVIVLMCTEPGDPCVDVISLAEDLASTAETCFPPNQCTTVYAASVPALVEILHDPNAVVELIVAMSGDVNHLSAVLRASMQQPRCIVITPCISQGTLLEVVPSVQEASSRLLRYMNRRATECLRVNETVTEICRECSADTLHQVLRFPVSMGTLTMFTVHEYASENLMFLTACRDYARLFHGGYTMENMRTVQRTAREIYNRFIRMHAAEQLNLSCHLCKDIKKTLRQLFSQGVNADWDQTRVIFDHAVDATLLVIERDVFSRFWEQEGPRIDPYLTWCCTKPLPLSSMQKGSAETETAEETEKGRADLEVEASLDQRQRQRDNGTAHEHGSMVPQPRNHTL